MDRKERRSGPVDGFKILEENRKRMEAELTLDDYIEFATRVNEFAGHPQRPLQPITGENFLL